MLLRWLPRLGPGGDAYLVVQRNLGADSLQRWLTDALASPTTGAGSTSPNRDGEASGEPGTAFDVERVASAKGFRVLRVSHG